MADLSDKTDDVAIWNEGRTKAATITTVSAKEALDTYIAGGTLTISSDDSPTKYQLKTDFDATGDLVTSAADVTLHTFTGAGVIDFIATSCGSSGYAIALVVDGVERYRMTMDQLGSDLGLTASGGTHIWVETANKNFRYDPTEGIGFKTSFAILAKATGANVTVKHLTMFREQVP
jgi:hypothetical protein